MEDNVVGRHVCGRPLLDGPVLGHVEDDRLFEKSDLLVVAVQDLLDVNLLEPRPGTVLEDDFGRDRRVPLRGERVDCDDLLFGLRITVDGVGLVQGVDR